MEDLTEIVKDVISLIDLNLPVKSITGQKIFLCSTLHLTIKKIVKDSSGNTYEITDFLNDQWIEVIYYGATSTDFDDDVVICPAITYLHGTPSTVNNEFLQISKTTRNKVPFVWLLENYEEEFFGRESSVERNSKFKLYFMDETNEKKWLTEEHHRLVIQPMMNLQEATIGVIRNTPAFKTIVSYQVKPRVKFGVYITNKGNTKKIIDENLSGCELSINLEKFKCKINC